VTARVVFHLFQPTPGLVAILLVAERFHGVVLHAAHAAAQHQRLTSKKLVCQRDLSAEPSILLVAELTERFSAHECAADGPLIGPAWLARLENLCVCARQETSGDK
jgi:hypothetical protein